MNRTRNPVVTVSEHHKPLDHPGVCFVLKLIYYIHCQVTPRQTSATPSPTVTDHHTYHHTHHHTHTHHTRRRINNNGSTTIINEDNAGARNEPQVRFFFFFFLLMMDFSKHDEPRLPRHLPPHQHICTHHGRVRDEPGSKGSRM